MVWTQEMRDRASATRKAKRDERIRLQREKMQGVVRSVGNPVVTAEVPAVAIVKTVATPTNGNGYDWRNAPIDEAIVKLGDLRRTYDAAAKIILERQAQSRPRWTCFTQLHKDIIPKSVQELCKKTGDDGKWASRDDGVFKVIDGLRVPDPQFCCSAICHESYLRTKQMGSLSRH